ncbi:MAG: hypothetical protein ACRDGM_04280 [bacterium]
MKTVKVRLLDPEGNFVISGEAPKCDAPHIILWMGRAFEYGVTDDEQVNVYIEVFISRLIETTSRQSPIS